MLGSLAGPLAAVEEGGWRFVTEHDGVTLEKRAVEGSRYNEYRARTHTSVPPDVAIGRLWDGIAHERAPSIKSRTVVRQAPDELVLYDRIHTPVVTDRDVTVRLRKLHSGGSYIVSFETANELGPPPSRDYVRLPVVRGAWRIDPDPAGGSFVSYRCYSEPGGSIPAFLVRGAQQDQVLAEFEHVLARVGR